MNPIALRIKEEVISVLANQAKAKAELQSKIDNNWLTSTISATDFAYAVSAEAEVNTIEFTLEFVEDKVENNLLSNYSEKDLLDTLTHKVEETTKRLAQLIKPCGADNRAEVYGTQNALARVKRIHSFANRRVNF